jgi:hypothetical protein
MDAQGLFKSVLKSGERLMWSYQPQLRPAGLRRFAVVTSLLWLGSLMLLRRISARGQHAVPTWLQVEVSCVAGFFFALPLLLFWLKLQWAEKTAYALTDRRVLMAVGPRREDVREVALTALGRVQLVNSRGGGKELLLNLRLPKRTFFGPKSVWTFPDSARADLSASPYLHVHDPAAVRDLLEEARKAVWYPAATADLKSRQSEQRQTDGD